MNIVKGFINYIQRDVSDEKESKEPAILLRLMCLGDVLCFIIVTIYQLMVFGTKNIIFSCVFAAIITALFFTSAKVSTSVSYIIYSMVTVVAVISLTVCFGYGPMYHVCLFFIICMMYFQPGIPRYIRAGSVVVSIATAIFLIAYGINNQPIMPVEMTDSIFLMCVNTFSIFSKVIINSFMYYRKFSVTDEKLLKYAKKLETFAVQDTLTKLFNRRGMFNYLENTEKKLKNDPDFWSIAIGDIDFFKKINDTYGHDAGDYVLLTVAKLMSSFMENKGRVSRWGGEEFLFSFEGKNGDEARGELEKLKSIISKYEFSYNKMTFNVTMTFGVEEYAGFLGVEKTINSADQKLYEGKKTGRNKVVF